MARDGGLHPFRRKFLEHAALQCGFCTPGLLIAAKALLDQNPDQPKPRPLLAGREPVPLHRLRQGDRAVMDAAAELRQAPSALKTESA